MRETAREILVADDVLNYAMRLVMATHPDSECPAAVSKKYSRYGASSRAAQAFISAARVRALMHGYFNVAYSDINAMALPLLRHRIKLNFEAMTEHISTDDVISEIIRELKDDGSAPAPAPAAPAEEQTENGPAPGEAAAGTDGAEGKTARKGLFGRKK